MYRNNMLTGGILFLTLGMADLCWLNFRVAPVVFNQPRRQVVAMEGREYSGSHLAVFVRDDSALTKGLDTGGLQSPKAGDIPIAPFSLAPVADDMGAGRPGQEERILFETNVFFATAHHRLTPKDSQCLDETLAVVQQHPETVVLIEGHADRRGSSDFNKRLSQKRAMAVVSFLQTRGIGMERITSSSFGASRPADPGDTPQAWARNRRVEIRIQKREP